MINLIIALLCTVPIQPVGPVPTQRQLDWQDRERYAFIHFGVNTFSDVEWGHGDEDPAIFNPSELDTDQWCQVFKDAGLTGVVITAKHHDGFCLWPSSLTEHSVKNSPWKDGKGDVLKELSESCAKYGLDFGVYLSPWDRNNPVYGTGEHYNEYFANQLRDVLTNYGRITEVWFDGACGEGPNGKRQVYDWPLFHSVVRECQPDAVMFSDAGPDIRWIGNESGFAGETNWSTMNKDEFYPGVPDKNKELNEGQEGGTHWLPGEVDVSIRPGWFYHASQDDKVKSPEKLFQIWLESVGRNANLLLNFPVDKRGLIHETDAKNAIEMRALIDEFVKNDIAPNGSADAELIDEDDDTYIVSNVGEAIEIKFDKPTSIWGVDVSEHIQFGQRVKSFRVEVLTDSDWVEVAKGTTIGHRRIFKFDAIHATAMRIVIEDALGDPVIETIRVYEAQLKEVGTVLDDDGGWCWFQDERAIVKDGVLYVGTVSTGYKDDSRCGDINVIMHDLESGESTTVELDDKLERDDHNLPALLAVDDVVLAIWSKHGTDLLTRIGTVTEEGSVVAKNTFTSDVRDGHRVTYANMFEMPNDCIVNFYRGLGWDPNAMVSKDGGESWEDKGQLLGGPGRPYVRYAQDADGNIHFAATEQHPRNFDNSIYHGKLEGSKVKNSVGELKGELGGSPPVPESLTLVFQGDEDNVAWCNDIEINSENHPVIVYSVQKGSAGLPVGQGGDDHRYRYAWFDGSQWHDHEVGFAGSRLYPREDDYTGLICIDPANTSIVYFSADAQPVTGERLEHYEIWKGETKDGGNSWAFTSITENSESDNIRPMMPIADVPILLWMEGTYRTYTNYDTRVRCLMI